MLIELIIKTSTMYYHHKWEYYKFTFNTHFDKEKRLRSKPYYCNASSPAYKFHNTLLCEVLIIDTQESAPTL